MTTNNKMRSSSSPSQRLRIHFLLAVLLLCCFFTCQSFALYEDDAGKQDWYKENMGRVNQMLLPSQQQQQKLLIVKTRENVLAGVKLRTGAIAWRRLFGDNDRLDQLKRVSDQQFVTFSSNCTNVRSWDENGLQMWQMKTTLPSSSSSDASSVCDAIPLTINQQLHVILTNAHSVYSVNAATGAIVWQYQSPASVLLSAAIKVDSDNKSIRVHGFKLNDKHVIEQVIQTILNVESGAVVKSLESAEINVRPLGQLSDSVRLLHNSVHILSNEGLFSIDAENNEKPTSQILFKDVNISGAENVSFGSGDSAFIHLNEQSTQRSYRFGIDGSKSGELVLLETYEPATRCSVSASLDGVLYIAEVTSQTEEAHVVVKNKDGKPVHEFSFARPQVQHGFIDVVYLQAFKNDDKTLGFRVVIVSEDDSLTVAKKDKQSWTREEGLAAIESSQFINLPRKLGYKPRTTESTYVYRIQSQINQLMNIVPTITNFVSSLMNPKSNNATEADLLFEDHFGFQKLILTRTASGKLFALHTVTGEIVWSILPKSLIGNRRSIAASSVTRTFVIRQQESGEETSVTPEIVALIAEGSSSTIVRLNALQGTVISAEELPAPFKSAIVLPITEKLSLYHPLLILDTDMNVHVYPDKTRMRSTLTMFNQQIYFYTSDEATSTVTGYSWSPSSASSKAVPVWTSKFEGKISTVSPNTSPQNEHIYSSVIISGKKVLHKYLNPNLFLVSSIESLEDSKTLHLYMIDSVTGRRVQHATFEDIEGPVSTLIDDNVVLCQYMSAKPRRPQLTVFELFVNSPSDQDASFIRSVIDRFSTQKQQVIASQDLQTPVMLQATYILPYAARTIVPTKTSIGVTSKEYLLALTNDQIMQLNKKAVDVRRPRAGMPIDEELIPYNPYVPYSTFNILTYNRTVYHVNHIHTEPSRLESTTHVFAHGIDNFYRRIAPSKPFDSLEEGFSHTLLLLTITGVILLTLAAKVYSEKKALTQLWQ